MTTPNPNPDPSPSKLPDPTDLTVAQLEAEIRALMGRADQAALADPLSLAVHLDDRVVRRPHLEVISSTIAQLTPGGGDRIMIICPPQVGKTWIACWSVLWWLIKHPEHRVIIGSYGTTLAADRGRTIRRLVEAFGQRYGLELMKGAKGVTNWSLDTGGGCRSAGVGAGITGMPADCVAEGTRIITRSGSLPVEQVAMMVSPEVLSYNHDTGHAEWRTVQASRRIPGREVVEVVTRSGRVLRCTADHRIYVADRGYLPAQDLRPGHRLIAGKGVADLRPLRRPVHETPLRGPQGQSQRVRTDLLHQTLSAGPRFRQGAEQRHPLQELRSTSDWPQGAEVQDLLLASVPARRHAGGRHLRGMPYDVPTPHLRAGEAASHGHQRPLLHQEVLGRVPCSHQSPLLRDMRNVNASGEASPILFQALPDRRTAKEQPGDGQCRREAVLPMRPGIHAGIVTAHLLRSNLRERRPFEEDGRYGELPLQGRQELRFLVPRDAATDPGTRRAPLHRMHGHGHADHLHAQWQTSDTVVAGHSPHQRGCGGQPSPESDYPVPPLPQTSPRVDDDAVAMVRHVHDERVAVYDLQVEGNSNFFANEVLVHNCFLIDDPVRSRADAESRLIREQIWDWWSGDVNSRLAPGAPVVLVQTRWHTDDLAGRLMAEEGTIQEGGRWRVIYLPAFAVPADADRGIPPDSLGRSPGQPLPHPRIAATDTARLAAHWEDKRRSATSRDWSALWQGDPRPVEGALVTRSLLRERHDYRPLATPIKHAISIDPAGEGRDSVGIVAGWLGDDLRLYVSHDASMTGGTSVEKWTHQAVMLAYQTDADVIIYEQNYGKAIVRRVITAAWEDAQRNEYIPRDIPMPLLVPEKAKKGKYLRAEPVAQLLTVDKIRLAAPMPELESEWCTWVPTDPMSPGRIDAMVYLAYRLLKPRRSRTGGGRSGINPGSVSRAQVLAQSGTGLTAPAPRGPDRFALRQTLRGAPPR